MAQSHVHAHEGTIRGGEGAVVEHGDVRVTDPVCGMQVKSDSVHRQAYQGQTYYFCSSECQEKFQAAPATYLRPTPKASEPEPASGVIYTCPMHPQIRATAPGACPICGMALEPLSPAVTEERNVELESMTRRFWVGLILSIPMLFMTMGRMILPFDIDAVLDSLFSGWPHWMKASWSQCVQGGLATPVVLWCGWPFLARGWKSFVTWQLNMFSLIGLGVAAAYVFSVFALFFPDWVTLD